MSLSNLYWREPLWLLLSLLPLLLILFNRIGQHRYWQRIADAELLPWLRTRPEQPSQQFALPLLILGWLLLCIALAGPRSIDWLPPEQRVDPARLVVVIDLSASMNATDIKPSRRHYAQQLLERWLSQRPPQIEVGLLLFAGHAFSLMSASNDDAALMHFTRSLTDIRLPTLGNNLSAALNLARQQLLSSQGDRRLLLLTDGDIEPAERALAEPLLAELSSDGIFSTLIGIGEQRSVTLPDLQGGLVMQQGRPVLSRLHSTWLQRLASLPSVAYLPWQNARQLTLAELLNLSQPRIDGQAQQQVIWQEWFALALLPGILLITASLFLERRQNAAASSGIIALLFSLVLLTTPDTPLHASEVDELQNLFAKGSACYKQKDFSCARQAFSEAAWRAQNPQQRARAVFNLANSYFFIGDYDQAAVLYRDAEQLGLDPALTRINLNYASSMQAAMQRHRQDIQKTLQRAQWRAAATGQPAPELSELLGVEIERLKQAGEDPSQRMYQPPAALLQQQLNGLLLDGQLGLSGMTTRPGSGHWIQTEAVLPQSTAAMMNRLFEMELEIMAPLNRPQQIEGKRPW